MNWLKYWIGISRLRHGFCPECNSSPPRPDCVICTGEHNYGRGMNPWVKAIWRDGWDRMYGR